MINSTTSVLSLSRRVGVCFQASSFKEIKSVIVTGCITGVWRGGSGKGTRHSCFKHLPAGSRLILTFFAGSKTAVRWLSEGLLALDKQNLWGCGTSGPML